jgi:hypothetical protein
MELETAPRRVPRYQRDSATMRIEFRPLMAR